MRPGRTLTVCRGDAYALTSEDERHVATILTTMSGVGKAKLSLSIAGAASMLSRFDRAREPCAPARLPAKMRTLSREERLGAARDANRLVAGPGTAPRSSLPHVLGEPSAQKKSQPTWTPRSCGPRASRKRT